MDFAASISTVDSAGAARAVPTTDLVIEHHRTGAAEVSLAVPSGGHLLHLATEVRLGSVEVRPIRRP